MERAQSALDYFNLCRKPESAAANLGTGRVTYDVATMLFPPFPLYSTSFFPFLHLLCSFSDEQWIVTPALTSSLISI